LGRHVFRNPGTPNRCGWLIGWIFVTTKISMYSLPHGAAHETSMYIIPPESILAIVSCFFSSPHSWAPDFGNFRVCQALCCRVFRINTFLKKTFYYQQLSYTLSGYSPFYVNTSDKYLRSKPKLQWGRAVA
jgi:hypothetical protein